jgi:hypothetical protein
MPLSDLEDDEWLEIRLAATGEDCSFGQNSKNNLLAPNNATNIISTTSLGDVSLDLLVEKLFIQRSSHQPHFVSLFEKNQMIL